MEDVFKRPMHVGVLATRDIQLICLEDDIHLTLMNIYDSVQYKLLLATNLKSYTHHLTIFPLAETESDDLQTVSSRAHLAALQIPDDDDYEYVSMRLAVVVFRTVLRKQLQL
jgi:hypothetical protein